MNATTKDSVTPNFLAQLRMAYTADTVPPCRVCGGPLSIAQCGGGEATVWACSINEDDPEREGYVRCKPGRGQGEFEPRTGHYALSQWTQYRGGDLRVLTLLDAFEAASADTARLDFMASELQREAQVKLPDGVRDCWAWAITSATPDLRAALDATMKPGVPK